MSLTGPEAGSAAAFDEMFAKLAVDPFVHELHRRAYRDEHPDGIDVFSTCTRGTLDRALARLRLAPGGVLVDLGCGLGGPGRWLARASGARVIGIDFSEVAIRAAERAAAGYLEPGRFDYRHGTFASTGLPDACADGIVSIDALPMAADRGAAVAELHRVLRPGARAFFTCAEWHGCDPLPHPSFAIRWAPLIADAGLVLVDTYVDHGNRARWLALYDLWLSNEAELRSRLGNAAKGMLLEARNAPRSVLLPGFLALQLTVRRPQCDER
jgi:SAM-dependent methyltransferase